MRCNLLLHYNINHLKPCSHIHSKGFLQWTSLGINQWISFFLCCSLHVYYSVLTIFLIQVCDFAISIYVARPDFKILVTSFTAFFFNFIFNSDDQVHLMQWSKVIVILILFFFSFQTKNNETFGEKKNVLP